MIEKLRSEFSLWKFDKKMYVFISVAMTISVGLIMIVSVIASVWSITGQSQKLVEEKVQTMTANTEVNFEQYQGIFWALMMDSDIQAYLQDEEAYGHLVQAQEALGNAFNMWDNMNFIGVISSDGNIGIRMTVPWESMGITEVFVVASGQEALKIFEKEKPDILITDICMTEVTGLELIANIRELNHDLKIIVLTGYDSFDYARECLRMKVDEFLLKPVDEDCLISTVQKLVNSLNEKQQKQVNEKRRILGDAEQCSLECVMNDFILKKPVSDEIFQSLEKDYQYNTNAVMQLAILYPDIHADGKIDTDNDSFTMMNIKNLLISVVDAQNLRKDELVIL